MSPVLTTLDARARRRLHAALRVGVAMDLHLDEPLPTDLVPAEVGPLFRHVEAADRALQASLRRWKSPRAQRVPGPAVTAILPACRGRPIGIPALRGQDLPVRVLVLSNGPNGPRRCPGAVVTRVPWTGHGPTRQGVLANVESPYVLLTVDDAVLLGAGCLRRMVQVLESGRWDAVVARQIPWPDADPVTRRRLRQWTPPSDGPQRLAQTDHVCTLYRTETLRK
ncbi:MAG: hypothetical protein VX000_07335, partial [Myxococcota bacterium]|nr:hypothetical protein [Myxococcota bacterium]